MTSSTTLFALSVNVSQFMLLPSVDPGPWPESCQPLWSNVAVFKLLAKRRRMSSLVNSSIPQSVWWMTNHSRVPRSLYEITNDRMASSLALPPAFLITWASPSARPAYFAGSRRASMQVSIAKWRLGGRGRLPLSPKFSAYLAFAANTSSRILDIILSSPHNGLRSAHHSIWRPRYGYRLAPADGCRLAHAGATLSKPILSPVGAAQISILVRLPRPPSEVAMPHQWSWAWTGRLRKSLRLARVLIAWSETGL